MAKRQIESRYLDAAEAAAYIGMSISSFERHCKELPCYRVNERTKRLYLREDLDAFMLRHRRASIEQEQLNALVDDVVRKLRNKNNKH